MPFSEKRFEQQPPSAFGRRAVVCSYGIRQKRSQSVRRTRRKAWHRGRVPRRSLIVHYPEKEFFVSCIACASGSAQINGMVRANLITVALPALKAERRDIIREPVHGKYIAVLHVIAIGIMPADQEFIRSVTVQIQKRKRDFLQQGGGILP